MPAAAPDCGGPELCRHAPLPHTTPRPGWQTGVSVELQGRGEPSTPPPAGAPGLQAQAQQPGSKRKRKRTRTRTSEQREAYRARRKQRRTAAAGGLPQGTAGTSVTKGADNGGPNQGSPPPLPPQSQQLPQPGDEGGGAASGVREGEQDTHEPPAMERLAAGVAAGADRLWQELEGSPWAAAAEVRRALPSAAARQAAAVIKDGRSANAAHLVMPRAPPDAI